MDLRARLQSVAPISGRQFAIFRIVFGGYLAIHCAQLVPWARELFSREGVLSNPRLNPLTGILPNVLTWWDAPAVVTSLLVAMTALALLFAAGIGRRAAAIALWYGWACLFNRNPLISNPSIPYVGLLLLLTVLVPPTEPWRVFQRRASEHDFYVPAGVVVAAWLLMSAGYTFSGAIKLLSPSWIDGTAIWHVLHNPLARSGWMRDLALVLPMPVLQLATWGALALELLFLPLAAWRVTRPYVWLAMAVLHAGIISLVSFADLSAGMLMIHLFTFDRRWPTRAFSIAGRGPARQLANRHNETRSRSAAAGPVSLADS